MPDLELPLGDRQLESVRDADGRVNLWSGAIRSGKTIASLLRFLMFVAMAPRGGEIVVIGRTRDTVARNVFGPLTDPAITGPLATLISYTAGAPTARILGRLVHVLGASDAKAEKVLRGLTVAGAYVDELTVIPEQFFTQLLGRMSVPGAQCFATTNPDTPAHWLKARFLDRLNQLPDWRHWTFTLDDNPSLTVDYVESIKREYTGLWYRRFVLGEWVAAEGAVYDMWNPDRHVVPWGQLPTMADLLAVGVDYGTTNASVGILLGRSAPIEHEPSRLYLIDEWRWDPQQAQTRLTDAQLSGRLRDWINTDDHLPYDTSLRPRFTVVDPAAASLKVQLHNDGVRNVFDAENDVAYGIRTMASGLAAGWLLVSDRCTGFIGEVPGYSWDKKATDKGEDKPIKVADHSLDAGRYAVATTEQMWNGHIVRAA